MCVCVCVCIIFLSRYLRPIELPASLQSSSASIGTMKHSSSYESFKQQKQQSSSPGSVRSGTSTPPSGFGIRKARSDPDVNLHSMQKEVEVEEDNERDVSLIDDDITYSILLLLLLSIVL